MVLSVCCLKVKILALNARYPSCSKCLTTANQLRKLLPAFNRKIILIKDTENSRDSLKRFKKQDLKLTYDLDTLA